MTPISDIRLLPAGDERAKITQLYRHLELFSEGEPPQQTLFVFAPAAGPLPIGASSAEEQLLVVDPPPDLTSRFRLPTQTAVLFTGVPIATDTPQVQTVAGGVAHLRVGDHFLDVYSGAERALVHLPAVGVICAGDVGSDATVPRLGTGSDGSGELDTLRLVARLLKAHKLSLYVPRVGSWVADKLEVMQRLAVDVEYLHGVRRVVMPLAQRGEALESIMQVAESTLPAARRTSAGWATHRANISSLVQTAGQTTTQ
jgi:hypothetical protein